MRIEVLSHIEHAQQRKAEPAAQQDSYKYAYERWSSARHKLVECLSTHGVFDSMESGNGDFFVGDDWFETGALHVVVVKWKVLTTDFLQACYDFLVPPYDDFLITLGKSMPAVEDMFQIVATKQRAYIGFFKKGEDEARTALNTHAHYSTIKALLA